VGDSAPQAPGSSSHCVEPNERGSRVLAESSATPDETVWRRTTRVCRFSHGTARQQRRRIDLQRPPPEPVMLSSRRPGGVVLAFRHSLSSASAGRDLPRFAKK